MVARVVTINAAGDRVGQVLDYYAGLAADQLDRDGTCRGPVDYYLDPNEPPGRWWGAGCPALGLTPGGLVLPEQLRALLEADHPADGRRLGRGFGDRSARGFDATFSAPKSVSVLWGLSEDPWVRAEVAAAHDAAVDAALSWVERHGLVTRRGYRGVDQVDARGLTVAVFRQHTSRTADPQVHTHAVISSKVRDDTGMWLALDARWLKRQQKSLSWVYDAALRSELASRLGLAWQPVLDGAGQTDLAGVPDGLTEVFSKRSRQVEAKLAELIARWTDEHDGIEPGPRQLYLLERRAVTSSRPGKDRAVDAEVLRADWQAQARASGFRLDRLPGGQGRLPGTEPVDADAVIAVALESGCDVVRSRPQSGEVRSEPAALLRIVLALGERRVEDEVDRSREVGAHPVVNPLLQLLGTTSHVNTPRSRGDDVAGRDTTNQRGPIDPRRQRRVGRSIPARGLFPSAAVQSEPRSHSNEVAGIREYRRCREALLRRRMLKNFFVEGGLGVATHRVLKPVGVPRQVSRAM